MRVRSFQQEINIGEAKAALLKEIEDHALQLSPRAHSELVRRLILSLEGTPEDTPVAIAQAWEEEIARRVADMEAGRTQWIPTDEFMARLRAMTLIA
jgi:putative addiction module component (TIGR02574 family)